MAVYHKHIEIKEDRREVGNNNNLKNTLTVLLVNVSGGFFFRYFCLDLECGIFEIVICQQ